MNYSHWNTKRTIGAAFIYLLILTATGQAAILRVSEHVVGGTGLGDSWPNAIPSLTAALSIAQGGDTIRVGQGIYHPTTGQSFMILDQMILKGGYAGWLPSGVLAADPNKRDVPNFQTILSGDLLGDDGPFINDLNYLRNSKLIDNADTVVMVQDVTRGTRIEGFFIERGAMNSPTGTLRGGGMFIVDSAMDVVNCTFRFNVAGIPFEIPEDPPNSDPGTTSEGGGAAVLGGHIIVNDVQYTRFINCTFHDNIAARGGALALVDGSNIPTQVKVLNSLFYDNQALVISNLILRPPDGSGGAILVYGLETSNSDVMVEITNCTIVNNNAELVTGGLRVVNIAPAFETVVQNCVFWGNDENETPSAASEITRTGNPIGTPSNLFVRYSDVEGGLTQSAGGSGPLRVFEVFSLAPDFEDEVNKDFRVPVTSPLVEAGDLDTSFILIDEFNLDNDNDTTELTPELDLRPRLIDKENDGIDRVDMGAYESEFLGTCCENVAHSGLLHQVNVTDLLAVLGSWGDCPEPCTAMVINSPDTCPADIQRNCDVDAFDLIAVLGAWGRCTGLCAATGSSQKAGSVSATQFPSLEEENDQFGPVSDTWSTSGDGLRLASDGFKPVQSTTVSQFNWWGFYEQAGVNCAGGYFDSFTIKYYDAVTHPETDELVPGSAFAIFNNVSLLVKKDTGDTLGNGIPLYFYSVNHVPIAVTAGTSYFVEVRNSGGDTTGATGCHWRWAWSEDGTIEYSVEKLDDATSYLDADDPENKMNLAFSLDIDFDQIDPDP